MLALGAEICNIDRKDPKHIEFTVTRNFDDFSKTVNSTDAVISTLSVDMKPSISIHLYEEELLWANGSLMVNALKFKDALQRLKGIIHSR